MNKLYILLLLLFVGCTLPERKQDDGIYWYEVQKGDLRGWVKEDDVLYATIVPIYNNSKTNVIGQVRCQDIPAMMK